MRTPGGRVGLKSTNPESSGSLVTCQSRAEESLEVVSGRTEGTQSEVMRFEGVVRRGASEELSRS